MTNSSWKGFEQLIARIHEVLDGQTFDIQHDSTRTEVHGGTAQIDVVLTPKTAPMGPILISCKDWKDPVGVTHIREWSDIVQRQGAAAGVIVARTGFTHGAIKAAEDPTRRLSLWILRPLTRDDFGPDEESPDGYISQVEGTLELVCPRLVQNSLKLKATPVDGEWPEELGTSFSASVRDQWYIQDSAGNILGNLWDRFLEAPKVKSGTITFSNASPSCTEFVIISNKKYRLESASCDIEVTIVRRTIAVDMTQTAFAYQNVLSGEVRHVPLPPRLLEQR